MKAVLFPFVQDDEVIEFIQDFPDLEWALASNADDAVRQLQNANIFVLGNRSCSSHLGRRLRESPPPLLRWIHFTTAGIDRGIKMGLPERCAITNASGVRAPAVAEHALSLLLCVLHQFSGCLSAQREHEWARSKIQPNVKPLQGLVACIVGLGAVGQEVARKLAAFDVTVRAVSRSTEPVPNVQTIYSREKIREGLDSADIVLLCAAADAGTRHIIAGGELQAMRKGAVVVNVARGELIDEDALVLALKTGHIGYAALDVTSAEPLPAENELWGLPNVFITPHIASGGGRAYEAQKKLFGANLSCFKSGKPLLNEISREGASC